MTQRCQTKKNGRYSDWYKRFFSKTGYFRFHGRNRAWFREPVEVRYNYLYPEKELREFATPIKDIARRAETTFVFFNNCHAGKAVKNAQMMKEMLNETS